jgi:hypothetical protein
MWSDKKFTTFRYNSIYSTPVCAGYMPSCSVDRLNPPPNLYTRASPGLPNVDDDQWEHQRGKSLSKATAIKAAIAMRHARATAPSWPEVKSLNHRWDIRSQPQPLVRKHLATGRSPYTPYGLINSSNPLTAFLKKSSGTVAL